MTSMSLNLPAAAPVLPGLSPGADPLSGATAPAEGAAAAGAFAGVLAAAQAQLGRQDLAASDPMAVPTLVSQTLGGGLHLITPAAPEPASDSLLAFARSQGLDEAAIAALWGQGAPPAPPAQAPASAPAPAPAPWLAPGLALQALAGNAPTAPGTAPPALTGLGVPQPALAPAEPPELGPTPPVPAAHSSATALPAPGLGAAQLWASLTPPAAPGWAPPPGAPAAAADPASEWPALDALASRLLPTPGKNTRTASPSPSLNPDAGLAAALAGPATRSGTGPVEVLDLQADLAQVLALDGLDSSPLEARPSSFAPPPSAGAEAGKSTAASAPTPGLVSGYQLKMEHFQQLADRLGVALAQRLQQQIERGQWSLQLRLNPAELGQVDVRLDMRSSGLEAMFQADNPLTRELIAQGAGRLRDGLTQSGMTVASVWVNSEGGRQSGGNPTPQRQPRSGPADTEVSAVASPEGLQPRPHSADGWDVLA